MPDAPAAPVVDEPIIPDVPETTTPDTQATADTSAATQQTTPTETVAATPPSPPSLSGLREFAKEKFGLDASQWQDDATLAEALFRHATEATQRQREAEHYRQMAAEYERRFQQPAPKAAEEEKPKSFFDKQPSFDPAWETMIEKDEVTGQLKPKAGFSPSVVHDYQEAMAWQQQFARQWFSDPKKAIRELAPDVIKEIVQEQFQFHQHQQTVSSIIDQNAAWLHVNDGKGNYARNADGTRMLSPLGQRWTYLTDWYEKAGVKDPAMQNQMAIDRLRLEALTAQQQAAPAAAVQPPKTNEEHKAAAVKAAARTPSATNGTTKQTSTKAMTMRERLARNLAEAGYGEDSTLTIGE